MKKSLLLSAVAAIALASGASAATLSLDNTNAIAGVIPGGGASNQVLENVFGFAPGADLSGGFFGSQILLDTAATVTASFFGYEAGFTNSFSAAGTELFIKATGPGTTDQAYAADALTPIATKDFSGNAGVLDFSFTVDDNNGLIQNLLNGFNPDNSISTNPNFYAWVDGKSGTSGDTIWLFLDDGGAGNDDNHDDFVVSLSVGGGGSIPTPVPLPAGGLLLLGGLGGLAALRRKKA